MELNDAVIRQFYDNFNRRAFDAAAALFTDDAVLEHEPVRRQKRGGAGYLDFVQMWTEAFPDAALKVDHVTTRDGVTYEVELRATGTHLGGLDMGGAGVFKPTGVRAAIRMRQLLEIRDGRITFSSLSFDLQDIVHQLVTVDAGRLLEHLQKIQQLGAKLSATPEEDLVGRRNLVDRLGAELDAARHVVRPHYGR
jgi:steroid delta-isomerase-like uncharacterized protein